MSVGLDEYEKQLLSKAIRSIFWKIILAKRKVAYMPEHNTMERILVWRVSQVDLPMHRMEWYTLEKEITQRLLVLAILRN